MTLRHDTNLVRDPLLLSFSDTPESRFTARTQYQLAVRWLVNKPTRVHFSLVAIHPSRSTSTFVLVSGRYQYSFSRIILASAWALSFQESTEASGNSMGYYGDWGLQGRFPVASLSGAASGMTLYANYRTGRTSIEIRYRETIKHGALALSLLDSRQIQFQMARTW